MRQRDSRIVGEHCQFLAESDDGLLPMRCEEAMSVGACRPIASAARTLGRGAQDRLPSSIRAAALP